VNGTRDIILKSELEQLEKDHPGRLQVTYTVSGPEAAPESPSLGDEKKFRKGYINKSILQEAIARCDSESLGDGKVKVWICGPPAMEGAVSGKKGVLAELGIVGKEVHKF
jgi:cytochrome-b5 reductase